MWVLVDLQLAIYFSNVVFNEIFPIKRNKKTNIWLPSASNWGSSLRQRLACALEGHGISELTLVMVSLWWRGGNFPRTQAHGHFFDIRGPWSIRSQHASEFCCSCLVCFFLVWNRWIIHTILKASHFFFGGAQKKHRDGRMDTWHGSEKGKCFRNWHKRDLADPKGRRVHEGFKRSEHNYMICRFLSFFCMKLWDFEKKLEFWNWKRRVVIVAQLFWWPTTTLRG